MATLAAFLSVVSMASAQFAPGNGSMRKTVGGFTTAEFHRLADSATTTSTITKTATWGKRIFTKTNLVVAGLTFIPAALSWFYDEAVKATGTGLDDYWQGTAVQVGTMDTTGRTSVGTSPNGYCYKVTTKVLSDSQGWLSSNVPGSCSPYNYHMPEQGETVHTFLARVGTSHWETQQANCSDCAPGTEWRDVGTGAFWAGGNVERVGIERGDLYDFLDTDPAALGALKDQVSPKYLQEKLPDTGMPYTYGDPLGDGSLTLDTVPTDNQWTDNPYFNPGTDTDGDGYTDWEEYEAGTNPSDPASTPDASPDPNRDADGDGYPDWFEVEHGTDPNDPASYPAVAAPEPAKDSDADGVVDAYDPCPFSASNTCAANAEAADLAQEATQQQVLGELQELNAGAFAGPDAESPALDTAALEAYEPALAPEAFDTLAAEAGGRFQVVLDATAGRVPFGLAGWLPAEPTLGDGTCPDLSSSVAGYGVGISICGTRADQILLDLRGVLVALMYFAAVMSLIWFAVAS